jgi:hypothetical protein
MEARGNTLRVLDAPIRQSSSGSRGCFVVLLATEASVDNASPRNQHRWRARRNHLASSGADEAAEVVLAAMDPLIANVHLHGETSSMVASAGQVRPTNYWQGRPWREVERWDTLSALVSLLGLRQSVPPHVLEIATARARTSLLCANEAGDLERRVDGDLKHGRKVSCAGLRTDTTLTWKEDVMPKPQQPELRRSDYGATSDDSAKIKATVQEKPTVKGAAGPIPEDNRPGHHPEDEQDKPRPEAFMEQCRGNCGTED